jgi:hypothetical protein
MQVFLLHGSKFMRVDKHKQSEQALGAILNLIRFKQPATLDEADARLRLIDQIAVEALGDADMAELHEGTESLSLARRVPVQAAYIRSQRLLRQKSLH